MIRRAHLVAFVALALGSPKGAFADEGPNSIDPFARHAKLDVLGPLLADAKATPAPSVTPPAKQQKPIAGPPGSVPPGGNCTVDDECAGRAYCDLGRCIEIRQRTSAILYYYQAGDRGYRFFVPIFWHWWGRDGNGRIVFPLYWHFQDYPSATEDTFVFLYQRHVDPH